jgi:stage II sporulation protein D
VNRKEAIPLSALFFSLLFLAASSSAGWAAPAPKVRVRIVNGVRSVPVRGFDLKFRSVNRQELRIEQASALRALASRPSLSARADRFSRWQFRCPSGGVVQAIQKSHGKYPLRTVYFAGPVRIESPSGFVTVKGKPYREKVFVYPISTRHGWECEAVNQVDIEHYLDGLVNAEFSAAWNREAIDAQVVAARTYAYYQIKLMTGKKAHFDLDSTVKDQVYDGSTREDYRSRLSAIRTRGLILKASKKDAWPIKAYYHSTCGGVTELPEVVWGKKMKGFHRRVTCPYCRNSPSFIWDVPLSAKEIAREIWEGARGLTGTDRDLIKTWPRTWEKEIRGSALLDLRVTSQNASGRAERVTSKWKNAEGKTYALEMSGTTFRAWIGPSRLKSTVFQVLAAGQDQWVLRGRGFGHGVGMCQWGAKTLGEKGKKAREILKFYYPDAVLARAW